MNVLIVGGGGREHALAWKVAQSASVERLFVAPGNAGTAGLARTANIDIEADDIEALAAFAREQDCQLTIVGPEAPLVAGIVDVFERAGLACFGPSAAAARLEGSKAYSKAFLTRHRIPTAAYQAFTDIAPALDYIRAHRAPWVIKADGLAAGKGVIIAHSEAEAIAAVHSMLGAKVFGAAGQKIIIEEFLSGEEVSFIVMVDGEHILPLATSQDHKARDNADRGPNTGGMGAYSPAPVVSAVLHQRIMRDVIEPTVRGIAADGWPYRGFLYAGLIITPAGEPKVLEYNCRCGDPETQPIMLRLQSDLVTLCIAALAQRLDQVQAEWDQRAALGVVMAAGGYPADYRKGDEIRGLSPAGDRASDVVVFQAGTRLEAGKTLTAGGRVLCVTALGTSVAEAQRKAYTRVEQIQWQNVYFRTDIGYRAIAAERADQR